jgi:maltose/moltooligosaccharide transporter
MTNWLDIGNTAPPGQIPDSVRFSFYIGGAVFLLAVLWTVLSTGEYSPAELEAFEATERPARPCSDPETRSASSFRLHGTAWAIGGCLLIAWIRYSLLDKQLYILAAAAIAFGIILLVCACMQARNNTHNGLYSIVDDLFHMPRIMRQLAVVQFFSWFGLFAMWIYGTAAVASHHFDSVDAGSRAYNDGADWVGVLFAAYNGFAALAAIMIPFVAGKLGCRWCHLLNLALGGAGLASFYLIRDPAMLLIPMIGVGIAWASILSMPYVLLSNTLPARKMGVYMGIFNFFIVIPQLVAASILGLLLRELFAGRSIFGLVIGGAALLIAGMSTLLVDRTAEPHVQGR